MGIDLPKCSSLIPQAGRPVQVPLAVSKGLVAHRHPDRPAHRPDWILDPCRRGGIWFFNKSQNSWLRRLPSTIT
jgi:hypothetical protein